MLLKWLMAKSKMYIVFAHAISSKINKTEDGQSLSFAAQLQLSLWNQPNSFSYFPLSQDPLAS